MWSIVLDFWIFWILWIFVFFWILIIYSQTNAVCSLLDSHHCPSAIPDLHLFHDATAASRMCCGQAEALLGMVSRSAKAFWINMDFSSWYVRQWFIVSSVFPQHHYQFCFQGILNKYGLLFLVCPAMIHCLKRLPPASLPVLLPRSDDGMMVDDSGCEHLVWMKPVSLHSLQATSNP